MFGLLYGLFKYLFSKAEYSVPLLGLDGAGKTTLTEKIKSLYTGTQPPENVTPTIGLNVRRVELGSVKLRFWDLSGEVGMRKIWSNYYEDADSIIFIVDGCDRDRLPEAKQSFDNIVQSGILKTKALLLFVNKSDDQTVMDASQINEYFQMDKLLPDSLKEYRILNCSSKDGSGLKTGIEWLGDYMQRYVISRDNKHHL